MIYYLEIFFSFIFLVIVVYAYYEIIIPWNSSINDIMLTLPAYVIAMVAVVKNDFQIYTSNESDCYWHIITRAHNNFLLGN